MAALPFETMLGEIETLVPHRPPMCWIDSLTECTDSSASATVTFSTDHFAVIKGAVPESALVECVAQTMAAATGYRRARAQEQPQIVNVHGMLLSVSGFHFQSPIPVGKPLRIEAREIKRFGPMVLVSGRVSCGGATIASGELTLYA